MNFIQAKYEIKTAATRSGMMVNFIIKGLLFAASELLCEQRCAALELGGCKPWEFREARSRDKSREWFCDPLSIIVHAEASHWTRFQLTRVATMDFEGRICETVLNIFL